MIHFISGDLQLVQKGIIGHQVNILGKAGSGIVVGIRNTFTGWYEEYKSLCDNNEQNREALLGVVQYFTVGQDLFVANLFAQFSIKPFNRNTDIPALTKCLTNLHETALAHGMDVYLPNLLASVRGGMDWEAEIYPIIEKLFVESSVNLFLVDYVKGQAI